MVRARQRVITAFLHFIQPLARLIGRARLGLTPWRLRGGKGWSAPVRREDVVWTEEWEHPDHRLAFLEESIRGAGAIPRQGSYCDPWDLYVRTGVFGEVRMLVCIEEHGRGRQYVRVRSWPTYSRGGLLAILVCGLWGAGALIAGAIGVGLVLAGAAAFLVISFIRQSGLAAAVVQCALTEARDSWGPERQRRTD